MILLIRQFAKPSTKKNEIEFVVDFCGDLPLAKAREKKLNKEKNELIVLEARVACLSAKLNVLLDEKNEPASMRSNRCRSV